jgi:hypothetical protein
VSVEREVLERLVWLEPLEVLTEMNQQLAAEVPVVAVGAVVMVVMAAMAVVVAVEDMRHREL